MGNLFNNLSKTNEKQNLLVFLTPHVIRNRSELRGLALDERAKFLKSLGKKELQDMPSTQLRELDKPSFSIAVPPEKDLNNHAEPLPANTEETSPSR